MEKSCDNCYFKADKDCRRYPPALVSVRGDTWTEWPEAPNVWCGEWKQSAASKEAQIKANSGKTPLELLNESIAEFKVNCPEEWEEMERKAEICRAQNKKLMEFKQWLNANHTGNNATLR